VPAPGKYRDLQPVVAAGAAAAGESASAAQPAAGDEAKAATEKPVSPDADPEHLIAVRTSGMDGQPNSEIDYRQSDLVLKRVAVNIWIRSGYLTRAAWHNTQEIPPRVDYNVVLDGLPLNCAAGASEVSDDSGANPKPGAAAVDLGGAGEADANPVADSVDEARWQLAQKAGTAAVAIEKFHRNALQRRLEWAYAKGVLAIRGTLPDVSLGAAQIRPSTVRQLVKGGLEITARRNLAPISDAQLSAILLDECHSIRLATIMIHHYLKKQDELKDAGDAYAGRSSHSRESIDYGPVLEAMVSMVAQ
jgi:hypothetical protein